MLEGIIEECRKCKGKGGFNTWGKPCLNGDMHFTMNCRSCKGKGYSVTAAAPVQVVQPTVVYQTQTPYGAASVNVVPAHNQQSVPLTAPTRNIMYWVAANAQRQQRWMTMGGDFFAAQRLWDIPPAEQSRR